MNYAFDISHDGATTLYQQLLAPGTYTLAAANMVQPNRASVATVGVPEQPSIGNSNGHRLTLDWNVTDGLDIKSITSLRRLGQNQFDNGSVETSNNFAIPPGGSFKGLTFSRYSLARFDQHQLSEELQAVGETPRFKYAGGVLFFRERVQDQAQAFATNQFTDTIGLNNTIIPVDYSKVRIDRASVVTTESYGAYGQVTYTPPVLNDQLHLTAGGRETRDVKNGQLALVNGALPNVNGVSAPRNLDATFTRFDPMVTIGYDVYQDSMVYGKWSTGYRSGGANSRSLFYSAFNPESVSMFELGAKTEFWQHRARLNAAVYSGEYKDIQVDFSAQYQQIDPVTGKLLQTLRTTTETINAPRPGYLRGAEADFAVTPIDGLTLSASYAYNKVKIPPTVNPFRQADGTLITAPIPIYQTYTPDSSGNIGADYEIPFDKFKLIAHIDANFDSGFYVNNTDVAYAPITHAVTIAQPKGDASSVVNARLSATDINLGTVKTTVYLWARNLFDEQRVFFRSGLGTAQGTSGFFNEPRTFGVQTQVKF